VIVADEEDSAAVSDLQQLPIRRPWRYDPARGGWRVAKSLSFRQEGRLCVVVHTQHAPDREEWKRLIARYHTFAKLPHACTLVRSYGGAPDGAQRKLLTDAMRGSTLSIAVMTNSIAARTVGTAVAWFNPRVKIVGIGDFEAAAEFLQLSSEERALAQSLLSALERKLSIVALSPGT
jgi:hypothetical protein